MLKVTSPGMQNPMTTLGDTIVGGSGGSPQRLAVGSNGQVAAGDTTAANGISYQSIHWHRNHLVNAGFDWWAANPGVALSGTLAATGAGSPANTYAYLADQWYLNNILGGGTVEGVVTWSQQPAANNGSGFGIDLTITTAPTGTGIGSTYFYLEQPLSNRATQALYNKTCSFSVLIKAKGLINQVGIQFVYATSEAKPAVGNTIGSQVLTTVTTGGWTLCTINGQALGTTSTTAGIIGVRITPTGVSSGHIYDLNNGIVIEQPMLNIGPVAMPWCRQYEDPDAEFKSCQYFYEKSYDPGTGRGSNTGNGVAAFSGYANDAGGDNCNSSVRFSAMKRVAGTVTVWDVPGNSGKVSWYNGSNTLTNNAVAANVNNQGILGFNMNCVLPNTSGDPHGAFFHWECDSRI